MAILISIINYVNIFLGEYKVGTDEAVFNRILARESFPQLHLIFEQYKEIAGKTIEQALKNELSGDLLEAMLALGFYQFLLFIIISILRKKVSLYCINSL